MVLTSGSAMSKTGGMTLRALRFRWLPLAWYSASLLALSVRAAAAGDAPLAVAAESGVSARVSVPAPVPVPEPTAQALRYHRGNLVWWGFRVGWSIAVPGVVLLTGFSARLREVAKRVGRKWFFMVAVYGCLLPAVLWLADLPWEYLQGFVREHAYGLSTQTFGKWAGDAVKDLVVAMGFGAMLLWLPYGLLRAFPRRWWLLTSIVSVPVAVFLVVVEPIWVAPWYNRFSPLQDRALERDILVLAELAGIENGRVFEVNKSVDTKAVNAYVAGLFATKRIVLWDTLLARLNRAETLFVMGHEMAHYVLGHVWQGVGVACVIVGLTLYLFPRVAGKLIGWFKLRLGFDQLQDVASLPLLLMMFQVFSLVWLPFVNAFSRHLEHEADRFGLELTADNHAAASSFVKLQQANLGVPRPGLVYRLWHASHPVLADRIEFCNTYAPWRHGQALRYGDRFRRGPPPRGSAEQKPPE
jgi:Zn-dependent protease with chaperone function